MTTSKIYKIESLLTPYIFIGCTTKKYLSERLTFYRSEYKMFTFKKDNDEYNIYIYIKIV